MAINDPLKVLAAFEGAESFAGAVLAVRDLVQRRVLRPALAAAMREIRDGIRDELPAKYAKRIRPLIGSGVKSNKSTGNVLVGVAGASAGIKRTGKTAEKREAKRIGGRGNRPGVGLSVANVHWFVLGTSERHTGIEKARKNRPGSVDKLTGNPIRYVGSIDPAKLGLGGVVERGLRKKESAAVRILAEGLMKGISREADKEFRKIGKAATKLAVKLAKR